MGKLFKLKSWLTLPEAQKHLTTIFGEEVSEADILRLALDSKLKLSVIFPSGVFASYCKPIYDEATVEYCEVPSLDGTAMLRLPVGGEIHYAPDGRMLQVQEKIIELEDDWPYDLLMMGGERGDIGFMYWELAGVPREETTNLDGTFVIDGQNVFQLKGMLPHKKGEQAAFYPLGGLPGGSAIVVKPNALLDLEKSIEENTAKEDKPLTTRERDNLLKLVIGMAIKGYRYNPSAAKSSTPKEIVEDLTSLGMNLSDDTVRKYLREAADSVLPIVVQKQ